ncbi:hypothetical protein [Acidithiobacillus thiooxidans]|uniref:Uncharacterized protein n=1 Tax=Acidithiobacillus thiooxidans ATCC 19377 TaxID=637390 RepID=A0A5P9XUH4_ACITH|nr:hypothetical protein [Acidithiobacillus thiooxidans]QFX96993.1 hypothetical protein GCD22_02854 [Acidithiobacillus thiooxidans ATCC 19377]
MKTRAEHQRERRKRLKAEGAICRLQAEISTPAALALIHLTTVRGQTTRAVLESLIMEAVTHAAA